MTDRREIERAMRGVYAARCRGDAAGTVASFAEHATFSINGRGVGPAVLGQPIAGKAQVQATIAELIAAWRFDDWQELALLVDGERAALHWTARVTCAPSGCTEVMDVVDLATFRDGRIVDYRQFTDTAMVKAMLPA